MAFPSFPAVTSLSLSSFAGVLSVLYLTYVGVVIIHRLYFSQYAKFPGPKLAALTYGYMFYYDVISGQGQYIYKIKQLHEEYSMSPTQSFFKIFLVNLRESLI